MTSDFVSVVSKPRITALAAALSIALMGAASAVSATKTPPTFQGFERGHAVAPHPRYNKQVAKQHKQLDMHRARDAIQHIVSTLPASRPAAHAPGIMKITSRADSGSGSLRSALENAADGDVIDLSALRGTISLTSTLQPNASVEIRGPGRDLLTINAGGLGRVITSAHPLRVSNVTIAGGNATTTRPVGGCLLIENDLTLSNALVTDCALDGTNYGYAYGGAIAVLGTATIDGSEISNNTVTAPDYAGGGGLAIIAQSATTASSLTNSTISGNSVTAGADTFGGGVAAAYHSYGLAAALTVTKSIISGNSLNATSVPAYYYTNYGYTYYGAGDGGGIWAQGTNLTITGGTVDANTITTNSVARGAGLFVQHEKYYNPTTTYYEPKGGQATITGTIVSNNVADSKGAAASGGGVYADGGLSLDVSTVSGNTAQTDTIQGAYAGGGGVYTGKYAEVSVVNSTISGNAATATTAGGSANGGGFCNSFQLNYALNAKLVNSTVSGNSATAVTASQSFGGGFYQSYQSYPVAFTVENSTIAFNSTGLVGGGVAAAYGATTTFNSVILSNNVAGTAGTEDVSSPSTLTIDGDYSLFSVDPTTGNANITITGTHNILGQDAVLLPLADNGGPTLTHALDPTSPAIDHGSNPEALLYDQRGAPNPRVFGAAADIGAFELVPDVIFKDGFE
jgi:hypothetical protein